MWWFGRRPKSVQLHTVGADTLSIDPATGSVHYLDGRPWKGVMAVERTDLPVESSAGVITEAAELLLQHLSEPALMLEALSSTNMSQIKKQLEMDQMREDKQLQELLDRKERLGPDPHEELSRLKERLAALEQKQGDDMRLAQQQKEALENDVLRLREQLNTRQLDLVVLRRSIQQLQQDTQTINSSSEDSIQRPLRTSIQQLQRQIESAKARLADVEKLRARTAVLRESIENNAYESSIEQIVTPPTITSTIWRSTTPTLSTVNAQLQAVSDRRADIVAENAAIAYELPAVVKEPIDPVPLSVPLDNISSPLSVSTLQSSPQHVLSFIESNWPDPGKVVMVQFVNFRLLSPEVLEWKYRTNLPLDDPDIQKQGVARYSQVSLIRSGPPQYLELQNVGEVILPTVFVYHLPDEISPEFISRISAHVRKTFDDDDVVLFVGASTARSLLADVTMRASFRKAVFCEDHS